MHEDSSLYVLVGTVKQAGRNDLVVYVLVHSSQFIIHCHTAVRRYVTYVVD
jgi:hypothetical protein